ncbi:MAG: AsmA family protein, partial [Nitrospira sp.]|nr:AsmA family protein [Nitrospira sp.]
RQAADFFAPRPIPERLHGAANLRGTIRVTPGVGGYDLVLSNMTTGMGHLSLKGQASLSGLMTAQPTFSLTFSSSPVDLNELLDWFPVQWVNDQFAAAVNQWDVEGLVEVVSATLTGTVKPELRASLTGEFRLQRGRALLESNQPQIENLSSIIIVETDRIKITEVTGRYGPLRMSGGKAAIAFLEAGPWLDLEVTGDMAGPDLAALLARSLNPAPLSQRFRELRNIQGTSTVTFRMAGPLNHFDKVRFLGGDVLAQNLGFDSPLAPETIQGLNGRIAFSPKGVAFDGLSGRVGEGRFDLHGNIDTAAAATFKNFTVRASADIAQVMKWFPIAAVPKTAMHGAIGATVDLSGPMEAPLIKADVELKDTALNFSETMKKSIGTPASLTFEAQLSRKQALAIDRLDLHLPPLRITGRGAVKLGPKFSLTASLVSNQIALATLPKGMSLGGLETGTLEVSLDVKGKGTDWKAWQITGWVALTDGRLTVKDLDAPIAGIYLRLQLIRNGAEIKRLAFTIKDSDISLSGSVKNWDKTPTISAKATSSQLDIDLLIPKGERAPIRDVLEDLAATSRATATFNIGRGLYQSLRLRDLSGQLAIRDGTVVLDNLQGETDGGTVEGHLHIRLPKLKPADVQASVRITDVPYDRFMRLAGDDHRLITGSLSTTMTLQGNGRDPQGVLHSLNGKADLLIKQGRVQKGTILPKILTILNLPTLLQGKVDLSKDGMPFDKVTSTLTVTNGVVTTENFVMDSPILKITGAGHYDMPADRLHAVVATSPLGSYAKLLKSIPLFGKLFAGERQGIDTAFFEVDGPLKDPKVSYMPIKSLATGLTGLGHLAFDLLKNTITLPKELIAPSDDAPAAPEKETTPPPQQAPAPLPPAVPEPAP